jgi:translation initiation factor 1
MEFVAMRHIVHSYCKYFHTLFTCWIAKLRIYAHIQPIIPKKVVTLPPHLSNIHMKKNDWKERLNVVYSTNPDFNYQTDEEPEADTLPRQQQRLRVSIEKKGRGGKTVTMVTGFVGSEDDLKELGRMLKSKCGVGGSAKDGEVLIQGECKQRVIDLLKAEGYTQTK